MMPTPVQTHGCSWDPLTRDDLPEVADLVAALEYLGESADHLDLAGLEAAYEDDAAAQERNGVVLRRPSQTLIAFAWIRPTGDPRGHAARVQVASASHPVWRHEGVQPTLLRWTVDRAVEWYAEQADPTLPPLEVASLVPSTNELATGLLREAGFEVQKWYHTMERHLGDLPCGDLPEVELRPFRPDDDAVRLLHNRHTGTDLDGDGWASLLRRAGIRPGLSWVAYAGPDPVGYALNALTAVGEGQHGWTEFLGAEPRWRRCGVLQSLLAASIGGFREAGCSGAGIGVEASSDQGNRPYRELGYAPVETLVWYVHHPRTATVIAAKSPTAQTTQQMGRR
jgi:mycothiol synthase